MGMKAKDFATMDLFDNIKNGNFPSWTWFVQIMPLAAWAQYRFAVNDITKAGIGAVVQFARTQGSDATHVDLSKNKINDQAATEEVTRLASL